MLIIYVNSFHLIIFYGISTLPKVDPLLITLIVNANNFFKEYLDEIVHKSESEFDLLMAHPKANGFLGAKGFAGGIPHAYTHIAKKFFNKIKKYGLQDR